MGWDERELVEVVKRLAASSDEQAGYLRLLGTFPSLDELALEFDDLCGSQGTTVPASRWRESLAKLDAALSAMSGTEHAYLWTAEALDRPEWAEIRALARDALQQRSD